MKRLLSALCAVLLVLSFGFTAFALEYTVQPGDTLWLISQKHGITLEELMLANPEITDVGNIYIGQVIRIPEKSAPDSLTKESLSYLYAGTTASYLKILDNTNQSIKTICPDYFDIESNGNLQITPSNKIDPVFIAEMHRRGILITPFISNHWDRTEGNAALDNREALSSQIAEMIETHNLDGINIDIENVNEQYREAYTEFTRLLRQKLPADKLVTVAVAANPKGWSVGWHGSYDYKALSEYSDYLMIMAYDESYHGGPAGPVSSSSFFKNAIQYAINQGVPKSKIVTGLPFFGRFWRQGDSVGGIGITVNDIEHLVKHYRSNVQYDETTQSAKASITISESDPKPTIWGGRVLSAGEYEIWYDNLQAIRHKLDVINQYGIKGAGSWALGQENPETWSFYHSALNGGAQPEPTPTPEPETPPEPETDEMTLAKILEILNSHGNNRAVSELTNLTRAEFVLLMATVTYVQPETNSPSFTDTANHWAAPYIHAFRRRGIIEGDRNNQFFPDRIITREEMCVILERILVLPNTIDFHQSAFKDVTPSMWSYPIIAKLNYFDLVHGVNRNFFKPYDPITPNTCLNILDRITKYSYPLNPDKLSVYKMFDALYQENSILKGPIIEPR